MNTSELVNTPIDGAKEMLINVKQSGINIATAWQITCAKKQKIMKKITENTSLKINADADKRQVDLLVSPLTNADIKSNIIMSRTWAMPSKWTFTIKPIRNLIWKYVKNPSNWVDPFAGENSPAGITNDLNPKRPAKYHLHATEFLRQLEGKYDGCLFDPPYSPHQTKECYEGIGITMNYEDDARHGWSKTRKLLAQKIKGGGYCVSFGWDTIGLGRKNGFEIVEILLVSHGIGHNDTIVTVEQKLAGLFDPQ